MDTQDPNPWQEMETAPKDATWVLGLLEDGAVVRMHYAESSGEGFMPRFKGWFRDATSYLMGVDPIKWKPLVEGE